MKFDGTDVIVQGCTTFAISLKMNLNSSKVQTIPTAISSARIACGNIDSPSKLLIMHSTSFKSYGN